MLTFHQWNLYLTTMALLQRRLGNILPGQAATSYYGFSVMQEGKMEFSECGSSWIFIVCIYIKKKKKLPASSLPNIQRWCGNRKSTVKLLFGKRKIKNTNSHWSIVTVQPPPALDWISWLAWLPWFCLWGEFPWSLSSRGSGFAFSEFLLCPLFPWSHIKLGKHISWELYHFHSLVLAVAGFSKHYHPLRHVEGW